MSRPGMRLVRRGDGGAPFPAPADHPYASFGLPFSDSGRRYYRSFTPPGWIDASFAMVDEDGALAVVEIDGWTEGALGRFGSPVEPWSRPGLSPALHRTLTRDVLGELSRLVRETGRTLSIRTGAKLDPTGAYAARLADLRARPDAAIRATIDLAQDDDMILADMRKGHRQQVRWGRDRLTIQVVAAGRRDDPAFAAYRRLHADIAGRVTRPDGSWQAMFDLIAEGWGDLILSYLDGELVGGAMLIDDAHTAYYASGAYRRDHFDKPLSHYPLFLAAQRARGRGRRLLDIGDTWGGAIDMADAKQRSIGRFKAGFSGTADISLVWTVAPLTD